MRNDSEFQELRRQAIALRREGKSTREIRETLGLSSNNRLMNDLLRGEPAPEWTKRPRAKDDLRARARELRAQGKSYNEIAAELGVSKSSCSLWLRDMPRPITKEEHIRRALAARQPGSARRRAETAARRLETKLAAAREIGELSDRDITLAGAMIYWCEGAKARSAGRRGRVAFCNNDARMIAFFLRFLDVVGVAHERLRFYLQIHENADVRAAERFWRELTGAAPDQFTKTHLKKARAVTNRKNTGPDYHGCLRVAVNGSADLYERIGSWARAILAFGHGDPLDASERVAALEVGALTARELKLLGALAYWCEGAKDKPYRRSERIDFINSDPAIVRFFLCFLDLIGVDAAQMGLRVHIHESADVAAAESYWAQVARVDPEGLRRAVVKRHAPRTRHDNGGIGYRGCLEIEVARSAEIYRRVEGWALACLLGLEQAERDWQSRYGACTEP